MVDVDCAFDDDDTLTEVERPTMSASKAVESRFASSLERTRKVSGGKGEQNFLLTRV